MAELSQIRPTLQYNACKNGINMTVKIKTGKNMAKCPKTRHFIPVIIIPSKVSHLQNFPAL